MKRYFFPCPPTGRALLAAAVFCTGSLSSHADNIQCSPDAPAQVQLAAKEIRRYVFLRTGELLSIASTASGKCIALNLDSVLSPQQYRLKTDGQTLFISGGSPEAVLYGAYDFATKLGIRFYLHGDTIPDGKIPLSIPQLNETHSPLFDLRGIQPFHDFAEGPDWWNQDDYLAYLSQLAKLRMNFLGLHTYPDGAPHAEPLVWTGLPQDVSPDGAVTFSYPSFWINTAANAWGYAPTKTSSFCGGASLLFPADNYGPDVQDGLMPRPKTVDQGNELFNRVGRQMNIIFGQAKTLGIKTCIGTETPLIIPKPLRDRLMQLGKDPNDPKTVQELYAGTFKRIKLAMPVDYYWLWTPETWTWKPNTPEQWARTQADFLAALAALKDLGNPFTLASCGWVLGPCEDRAALDSVLPKSSPMSCINRDLGHEGVEPGFSAVVGRPKWAIPWMENDRNMVGPQPWVGRMRYDAADALRLKCTGLIGIHWRSKAIAGNVAALADAGWNQSWAPAAFDQKPVTSGKFAEGALGGSNLTLPTQEGGSANSAVFQTARVGLEGYALTVPSGDYTVKLQFIEPEFASAGKRVFGVKIQDRQVVSGLDLYAKAGTGKALELSFPKISVADGLLRIVFPREVGAPCISGIVISGTTKASNQFRGEPFDRKINCGGNAYGDYEADRIGSNAPIGAGRDREMRVEDFYLDFARANFGDGVAERAGKILTAIDGVHMREPSTWRGGPGCVVIPKEDWSIVRKDYAFVDELEALRPQVQGAGNLERFDYWLNTYRASRTMAEAGCIRARLDKAMAGKRYDEALAARIELAKAWTRLISLQTTIVSTPGELGTIANLEQHSRGSSKFLTAHDEELAAALGKPLPMETHPGMDYDGPAKIIVPTVRTAAHSGESITLRVFVLDNQPAKKASLYWRFLGNGEYQRIELEHVARAVYRVVLPPAASDFEYYITAETVNGSKLQWPASTPESNQTVVVN